MMVSVINFPFAGSSYKPKSDYELLQEAIFKSKLDKEEEKKIFELIDAIPIEQRKDFFKTILSKIENGKSICLDLFRDSDLPTAQNPGEQSINSQNSFSSIAEEMISLQRNMLLMMLGTPSKKEKVKTDNIPLPTQARKARRVRKIKTKIPSELRKFTPPPKEETSSVEIEQPVVETSSPIKQNTPIKKKKNAKAHGKSTGKTKNKNRKNIPIAVEKKPLTNKKLGTCRVANGALTSQSETTSPAEVRKVFFDKLTNPKRIQKKWKLTQRVQRWQTENTVHIRQFEDKVGGRVIKQYEFESEEQLRILRAKHYFPETERLLCKSYRKIYAIPTKRGYGVMAKFSIDNGKTEEGMLFFGCDEKHKIFHMFFEAGVGDKQHYNGVDSQLEYDSDDEEENLNAPIQDVAISEKDGVVEFNYGQYRLNVYPVDRRSLDKEVPRLHG